MKRDPRRATRDDLSAIESIVGDAYSKYLTRIRLKPEPFRADYGVLIDRGCLYVAERDGIVRGILVLIPQADAMLLDNVAVAPVAQGTGLGRSLLEFAERAALAAGYRSIRLYTNEAMIENLALYSRIGYAETHRVEEKGLRRVYMVKALA
ncbi:MAG TPA: GNAT family N-acetyltransferase [Hyphomicrobiales bacterium]|nr:GNAT family N-acetyltransferase [Hyphomicrobiales bacterium]